MAYRFRREELYQLVWSKPMSNLAKELGVSDVGLTKACRRAGIPVPGLGYWAKIQHGKTVARAPLPPAIDGSPTTVVISPGTRRLRPADLPAEIAELVAQEESPESRVDAIKTLARPHPLVRSWLQAGRPSDVQGWQSHVRALTKTERRRLRILSSLLSALEKRGHKVLADQTDRRNVALLVAGERVEFSLTERQRQFKEELTAQERRSPLNFGREYRILRDPTGELVLRIRSWVGRGVRTGWHDRPGKPLEELLNSVIVGLLMASAVVRRKREEREEAERRWRGEEKRRLERAEAERNEARRRRELLDLVARWREAGEIRAYVKAVRSFASNAKDRMCVDRLEAFSKWALAIADDLDLLITGDPLPVERFVHG